MSQNESTPFLVTDAKNLTLIDATIENSPWWGLTCTVQVGPWANLHNGILGAQGVGCGFQMKKSKQERLPSNNLGLYDSV